MSLFSFLKQTQPIVLSFHDDGLQILQFGRHENSVNLVGYNEVALAKGIVIEGNIMDMDAFQSALTELLSQAKPNPIKNGRLYVNVPHHLLYTFVEDFASGTKEDSIKDSILGKIKQHSPVPVEELVLDFDSAHTGHKLSFATYGSPKKWRKRLIKACQNAGITSVEFVPEPICHKALFTESVAGDFALFSNHGGRIFFSIFRNGLVYDDYLLAELQDEGPIDCAGCFAEFKRAQEDFMGHFGSPLSTMLFVGFNEIQKKSLEAHFESEKNALNFFEPEKMANIGKLLPYKPERSTLFGLLHFLVQGEKRVKPIIPEQKALEFHRKFF